MKKDRIVIFRTEGGPLDKFKAKLKARGLKLSKVFQNFIKKYK